MAEMTKSDIGAFLARQGILIAFILFMIGFTVANARFVDPDNIMGVVRSSAILGVMALGGSGTIVKTVIGVLILGFIQNGLLLMGLQFYAQYVVTWIIIILAVWLDIAAKRGKLWSPIA